MFIMTHVLCKRIVDLEDANARLKKRVEDLEEVGIQCGKMMEDGSRRIEKSIETLNELNAQLKLPHKQGLAQASAAIKILTSFLNEINANVNEEAARNAKT